jgi:hypothetical protein
MQKFNLHL